MEEVACGLLLVGLALHMASPAARYAPEPLTFLTDALWSAVGACAAQPPASTTSRKSKGGGKADKGGGDAPGAVAAALGREGGQSIPRVAPGVLAPHASGASLAALEPEGTQLLAWLERANSGAAASSSGRGAGAGAAGRREQGDEVKLGALGTVLKVSKSCACVGGQGACAASCARNKESLLEQTGTSTCILPREEGLPQLGKGGEG